VILKIRSTCVHQGGFVQFPTLFGSLRDRKGLLLRSAGQFLLIGLDVGDECCVHCLDSVTIYTVSEREKCCSSPRNTALWYFCTSAPCIGTSNDLANTPPRKGVTPPPNGVTPSHHNHHHAHHQYSLLKRVASADSLAIVLRSWSTPDHQLRYLQP